MSSDYVGKGGIKAEAPQPKGSRGRAKEERSSPLEKLRVRMAAEGYSTFHNKGNKGTTDSDLTETDEECNSREHHKSKKDDNQWTHAEKQMCVVIIICGILIVLLLVLVVLFHLQLDSKNENCDTANCVMIAGEFLSKMDRTTDPCDDFYQYACGNDIINPLIPPDKVKWGSFAKTKQKIFAIVKRLLDEKGSRYMGTNSTAIKKAKIYYQACMNESAVEDLGNEPMQKLIKRVGSWPLISDNISGSWDPDTWSLEKNLAKSHLLSSSAFFSSGVGLDEMNNTVYTISFDQSGLTFSNYESYLGNETKKYHDAFVNYMGDVAHLLGASRADSDRVAEELWQFETKIAKSFMKNEERQNVWDLYNKMTLQKLQDKHFGGFDMALYMRQLFGRKIPMTVEVTVTAVKFMDRMRDLIEESPKETLANYLVWHTVSGMVRFMPASYQSVRHELSRVLYGLTSVPPRWEVCVGRVTDVLGFATGAMYVKDYFPPEQKQQVEKIAENIVNAFEASLPTVEWMDRVTRQTALVKAQAITLKFGYPDFITSPSELDEHYSNLTVHRNEQFENELESYTFGSNRVLARYGHAPDKSEWSMTPTEVNAYYSPTHNEMVFPAAILQAPFYDPRYPVAFNYGFIGAVIGHELTHGFDNTGSNFDKDGNMFDWWTNSSRQQFNQRKECLVDEYNAFRVGDSHVNGITTLNENMADNGGLKASLSAFTTYMDSRGWVDPKAHLPGLDMSQEQLFFLGFSQLWCSYYTPEYAKESLVTDVHTYTKYRVIGTVSNFPEFAEAYSCKNGPMNPKKKCNMW